MKTYIARIILVVVALSLTTSCDLERLESAQEVAPGGGTLDTFTAYTIDSTDPDGSNVYGRIVFWETSLNQTLVQISLFNTIPGTLHPALVLDGAVESAGATMLTLDDVSGDTGELNSNKLFLIADTNFYDSILTMDSHVNIYLSETDNTVVASGNLGINADPVDSN
ncbi:hypothetical protein EJ994_10905 [Maribacter sp. MJ134]|uniref:hypothetical protein n=1 Tax=Maribacter sp. MJ134 TaxID=2496865 RepID=UPI000F8400A0|nr:hypothetical protein [Maribacter sp. MJ134]AZQ59290.1 hypothetical protein EJ994_10905 [Maribacter sp. MJ134]